LPTTRTFTAIGFSTADDTVTGTGPPAPRPPRAAPAAGVPAFDGGAAAPPLEQDVVNVNPARTASVGRTRAG
jgi:hypothetical protein